MSSLLPQEIADALQPILQWLWGTRLAELVRDSLWGYPIAESLHLLSITMMFGSIVLADLRFIGMGRSMPASLLCEKYLLRFTWVAFLFVVASGLLLFSAYAPENIGNVAFQLKMIVMALAGLNMMYFTFRVSRGLATWDRDLPPPLSARISAGLSILLWASTICLGRLIATPEIFEAI